MNDNNLLEKITELCQKNFDIETEQDIKFIIKKIKFIENQIKFYKDNKPFFLFGRKKKDYYDRINKLEELNIILYNALGREIPKKQP